MHVHRLGILLLAASFTMIACGEDLPSDGKLDPAAPPGKADDVYGACQVDQLLAWVNNPETSVEVLKEAGSSVVERVPEKDPLALLLQFGNSSVDFEVSIWAEDPWAARVTRSKLNMAIWDHLKAAGVTIAFPQLDVHFDEGVNRIAADAAKQGTREGKEDG